MSTRIYTKTGDRGETGLFGGERVPKDHLRVAAYGDVDELNAALGLARSACADSRLDELLGRLQALLFELGSELATPPGKKTTTHRVTIVDVTFLEQAIDAFEATLKPLKTFILPGGSELSARFHVCRTVCRRAERSLVTLRRSESATPGETVIFLNRLSDLCFVLARVANANASRDDIPWQPRGT